MDRISSNTIQVKNRFGIKEILRHFKDAGFDTYDFTMYGMRFARDVFVDKEDYKERALDLRKYADELGLVCNQTHAEFPTKDLRRTEEENSLGFKYTIRSLEITSILGAKYCVIHPVADYGDEENAEFYKLLLPYAKKFGVKIAVENMWIWDKEKDCAKTAPCSNHINFVNLLNLINEEDVVACLDIGHAEMNGLNTSSVEMIKALGDKLQCLHIHDNNKKYDEHQIPYSGCINFEEIIDALAEINYRGDMTFECNQFFIKSPESMLTECLKLMHSIGVYFRDELVKRRDK